MEQEKDDYFEYLEDLMKEVNEDSRLGRNENNSSIIANPSSTIPQRSRMEPIEIEHDLDEVVFEHNSNDGSSEVLTIDDSGSIESEEYYYSLNTRHQFKSVYDIMIKLTEQSEEESKRREKIRQEKAKIIKARKGNLPMNIFNWCIWFEIMDPDLSFQGICCGKAWWVGCIMTHLDHQNKWPNWRKEIDYSDLIRNRTLINLFDEMKEIQGVEINKEDICENHSEQALGLCQTCNELVCFKCVCQGHNNHSVIEKKKAYKEFKENVIIVKEAYKNLENTIVKIWNRKKKDRKIKSYFDGRLSEMIKNITIKSPKPLTNKKTESLDKIKDSIKLLSWKLTNIFKVDKKEKPRIQELAILNSSIAEELIWEGEKMWKYKIDEFSDFYKTRSNQFVIKISSDKDGNDAYIPNNDGDISIEIDFKSNDIRVNDVLMRVNSKIIKPCLVLIWNSDTSGREFKIIEPIKYIKPNELIKIGELQNYINQKVELSLNVYVFEETKEVKDYLSRSFKQAELNIIHGLNQIKEKLNITKK